MNVRGYKMKIDFRFAVLVVSTALFFGGCSHNPKPLPDVPPTGPQVINVWQMIDPLPSKGVTYVDPKTGEDIHKAWAQLGNEQIRELLPNIDAEISVEKLDANGNLTYLVAKASATIGTYRVTMDYAQYRLEPVSESIINKSKPNGGKSNNPNNAVGFGRIGIGLRMTADVNTKKADINLGSLLALGVAASLNYLKGSLKVEIIGIGSADVGNLVLLPSVIDEGTIQKTLESMAAIKAKISDSKLTPHILAVKTTDTTYTTRDVKASLIGH